MNKKLPTSRFQIPNSKNGYVALIVVLTVSAIVFIIATAVSSLSVGELQSSLSHSKGEETLSFVEGCMEDALLKAQESAEYSGGNITRPEGTCTVVVSKAGDDWTVSVSTTSSSYTRTIRAQINRGANITITSWQEI